MRAGWKRRARPVGEPSLLIQEPLRPSGPSTLSSSSSLFFCTRKGKNRKESRTQSLIASCSSWKIEFIGPGIWPASCPADPIPRSFSVSCCCCRVDLSFFAQLNKEEIRWNPFLGGSPLVLRVDAAAVEWSFHRKMDGARGCKFATSSPEREAPLGQCTGSIPLSDQYSDGAATVNELYPESLRSP